MFLPFVVRPISKSNGSVRPIAVVNLMRRIWATTILKATFEPKFLLPFQTGLMSAAGVEQIVSAV